MNFLYVTLVQIKIMNEHHIKTLHIENFKSIKEMELECSRINVFVGKPNVGKSNILEALGMYGAGFSKNADKYLSDNVRYNAFSNLFYDNETHLNVQMSINNVHHISLSFDDENEQYKLVYSKENAENQSKTNEEIKLDNSGKIIDSPLPNAKRVKKYTFKAATTYNQPSNGYLRPPHGANLVKTIETSKALRSKIANFFTEYGAEILLDPKAKTIEIQKKIDGVSYKTDYNLVADTLQRMIFHHAAILSNKNSVILFEEPESHAYPPYISELAEAIIDDENNNQYFLTTHSPFIFNKLMAKTKENEFAAFIVYYENYETKLYRLTDKDMSDLLDHGADVFYNLNWFIND